MIGEFGKNLTFFSEYLVDPSNFDNVEELQNEVFDWWMLGEGDVMFVSRGSTFAEFAQYRQGKPETHFIIGGSTTCEEKSTSSSYFQKASAWVKSFFQRLITEYKVILQKTK